MTHTIMQPMTHTVVPPMTDTIIQLADGIKGMLALDEVDLDRPLSQIGVDSLNVVEMIIICQQVYTNVINYDAINIDENTTIREIDEQMLALSAP
ncbi:MAG: acyl carrier protein [Hyphomicrobiales bacterium]|nr:acyl carrier protein [Hyphomicrobiales bacterium]MBV8825500.1 acyl carrier protein [Hyphomicrobiales bacterium]MBV9429426.1 acyl carrier protein [Bradyrhizobiaceae bacterium]